MVTKPGAETEEKKSQIPIESKEPATESYQEVASQNEDKVTASTEYRIRYIQEKSNGIIEKEEKIPVKYIGLTREELENEIQQYALAPSLEDLEKGFLNASLESFSKTCVVVNKFYHIEEKATEESYFFLVAENHFVTVYRNDEKTVYLNTNISLDTLPEELQNEILDTKYIEDKGELYNFLESYSS